MISSAEGDRSANDKLEGKGGVDARTVYTVTVPGVTSLAEGLGIAAASVVKFNSMFPTSSDIWYGSLFESLRKWEGTISRVQFLHK